MKDSNFYNTIFWDFDGVILNSNKVRDVGFKTVLKDFPQKQIDLLLKYHQMNGGLSRYVKFRYFFETIRAERATEELIGDYANRFSLIMRELLTDKELIIKETYRYIEANHHKIPMYIVSGSDQEELRFLCKKLGLEPYFKRIHGSPKPKRDWVKEIVEEEKIAVKDSILIGDSVNDYEAARENNMAFMAYNNPSLEKYSTKTIDFK